MFQWIHPSIFKLTEELFTEFTIANRENLKAEFFIPIVADYFIKNEGGKINAIPTSSQWFGVTYKEYAPSVKADLDTLIKDKIYPSSLWNV